MATANDRAVLQTIFNPSTPFGDIPGLDEDEDVRHEGEADARLGVPLDPSHGGGRGSACIQRWGSRCCPGVTARWDEGRLFPAQRRRPSSRSCWSR